MRYSRALLLIVAGLMVCAIVIPAVWIISNRDTQAKIVAHSSILDNTSMLPQYPLQSSEQISSIPNSELEFAVVNSVMNKIQSDYTREHEIVTNLSVGQQMVYTTWVVEAEVNNGGFNQYFFNTEGILANEALAGFKLLGATKHAMLLEKAMSIYPKEKAQLDQARQEMQQAGTLHEFSSTYENSEFNALDDLFYAADAEEDTSKLTIRYIREHSEQFIGD